MDKRYEAGRIMLFIQSFYPNASMIVQGIYDRLGHIIVGLGTGLIAQLVQLHYLYF